jgi:hypothetical protein
VRKEEICVLGLVFPVGKPKKMLFSLFLNLLKTMNYLDDTNSPLKGNNPDLLINKASLYWHE